MYVYRESGTATFTTDTLTNTYFRWGGLESVNVRTDTSDTSYYIQTDIPCAGGGTHIEIAEDWRQNTTYHYAALNAEGIGGSVDLSPQRISFSSVYKIYTEYYEEWAFEYNEVDCGAYETGCNDMERTFQSQDICLGRWRTTIHEYSEITGPFGLLTPEFIVQQEGSVDECDDPMDMLPTWSGILSRDIFKFGGAFSYHTLCVVGGVRHPDSDPSEDSGIGRVQWYEDRGDTLGVHPGSIPSSSVIAAEMGYATSATIVQLVEEVEVWQTKVL
jgi:hypothetical protein